VAGYIDDGNGVTYVVVAIVNHPLATRQVARPILDELVDWFVRQPIKPGG
jgi:D-alanyl-D-alanine carboxypeptidase